MLFSHKLVGRMWAFWWFIWCRLWIVDGLVVSLKRAGMHDRGEYRFKHTVKKWRYTTIYARKIRLREGVPSK